MRVLLTGGFGYFGTALALRLSSEHDVWIAGRPPRLAVAERLRALLRELRIPCSSPELWPPEAPEVEAVVHLAGGGSSGGHSMDPMADLRDNVESVCQVAACMNPRARLLLASSIYVYGTGLYPFREADPLAPDTLYGQCKAMAEAVVRQQGGVALRFAHLYGAGSCLDFGRDGVTERLARAAAGGAPFAMRGDGAQRVDLVHIDDACEAVVLALRLQNLPPAINIGGGAPVSVADLARVFGAADGAADESVTDPQITELVRSERVLDIALACDKLHWAPRVTLAQGAQGLLQMIRGA
jgi:UDP-glucose 4-epimerase